MAYDLMLLADPGPSRGEVLLVLGAEPDVRPDRELDNRFWLTLEAGEAQINIGTKDPVESIHFEFEAGELPLMGAVVRRVLDLAQRLEMRVEDVQWGHEVTAANLSKLEQHWRGSYSSPPGDAAAGEKRPWWRPW
jgi:hypothetical protein